MRAKHARFIAEYLIDLNGRQAAIRAGYSPKTAEVQASQLLSKPNIRAAVAAAQEKRLKKLDISAERVLSELARIGFSDLRGVFDEDGSLLAMSDLPDDVAPIIASVEVTRERTRVNGDRTETESVTKVRAWDKVKALELLAKNLGLLKDRLQIEGVPALRVIRGPE